MLFCGRESVVQDFAKKNNESYVETEYGTFPETVTDGALTYYIINNEYAAVKSCAKDAVGTVDVPASINGLPVRYIWTYAFSDCKNITGISLPETITDIFSYAFYGCEKLESINIPSDVTKIGTGTFCACHGLKGIKLPDGLKRIEEEAFLSSGLETIELPEGVEFIGRRAFGNLNIGENTLTLPKSAEIRDEAFSGTGVKKVIVPKTQVINYKAFDDQNITFYVYANSPAQLSCEENEKIYYLIDGGMTEPYEYSDYVWKHDDYGNLLGSYSVNYLIIGNTAVVMTVNSTELETIEIPESINGASVTQIADYAFHDVERVKKIVLPESVTKIGKGAFEGSRGEESYYGCGGLEEINIPFGVKVIKDRTFAGCEMLKSVELPEGLTEIGVEAFAGCGIESVTFPKSLTKIGESAFEGSGLKVLDYPNVNVEKWAFHDCKKLTELNIASGVTYIPEKAFEGCERLGKAFIPESIKEFGYYSFFNCPRLIFVTESSYMYNYAILYAKEHGIMYCPKVVEYEIETHDYTYNNVNYYLVHNGMGDYRYSAVVLPGEYNFSDKVTIPQNITYDGDVYTVTKIGDSAFERADITAIELPDTITVIGDLAFNGCWSLKDINIPENVQVIGATALAARGLTGTLVYPKCRVGAAAFATSGYNTVYVPEGVTELPDHIFTHTPSLETITLPSTLEKIGKLAIYDTSVKNLIIPEKAILEEDAFYGLIALEKLTLSEGMTRLERNFRWCRNLKLVYLPKSLEYINYESFDDCPNAVFCVYENSYAHKFAEKKGLPYFILGTKKNPEIAYGAEISGKASYSDGTPVSNASAEILYDDGTIKESVNTDENGEYKFTYAEVGSYTIRITDTEGRTGTEQISVKRKNVFDVIVTGATDITVKNSWSISGNVVPQGSAKLTLTDTDGNIIAAAETEDGRYTISGVPNGSYIIKAENEKGSAVKEITVFDSDISDADIEIKEKSASAEGYVEIEDRSFNRYKRSWAQVTVYNEQGVAVAAGKTDENGKYVFEKLPLGSYSIAAEATEMRPEHGRLYKKTVTLTGYAYITLSEPKLYTVDTIVLTEQSDSSAKIFGKVFSKGKGCGAEVILADIFRREIAKCNTQEDGQYSFLNIRDGLYFITAITEKDGMGLTVAAVRGGIVYGTTDIYVYKPQRIAEHEEKMNNIPHCENREEALKYKNYIMEEKRFYDGLSEKEQNHFSRDYVNRLSTLSEYISSYECNVNGGELSRGGMIISADELADENKVQLNLNIEKRAPWTIGENGVKTDEDFMQQSVEEAKGSETAAQYYDISLSKSTDGIEKQITDVKKDTDTTGKVRITIPVPDEYKGHKKYSFVHVHNGITSTLVDLDDNPDTVTFEIDEFSTFVLTYSDSEDTENNYPANITYADGKIKVLSNKAASVYIAEYAGEKLVSVIKTDIEAEKEESFDFDETKAAFVWDENLVPLCEKFVLKNN